jgi:hypothetical protein
MLLRWKSITQRLFVCFGFCATGLVPGALCQTWALIDVPGADGSPPESNAEPTSINESGAVTGYWAPFPGGVLSSYHGFVRDPAGTVTTFDAPGSAGFGTFFGTFPFSINAAGAITGYYQAPPPFPSPLHGFVRSLEGNFTSFDPPGSISTKPQSINASGAIAGYYNEANQIVHGFVRRPNGNITSFDPPGSISTMALSINSEGAITGYYHEANNVVHGFVRRADGTIVTFDAPESTGTFPVSINDRGAITGSYNFANSGRAFGFVRESDGKFTTFDSGIPTSINLEGTTTGGGSAGLGFVRDPGGTITLFDASSQIACAGRTMPSSINAAGVITGSCGGPPFLGFVRYP